MKSLDALGLTPAQLAEIGQADDELVQAWLEHVLTASGVHSPAGLFVSGVRSGNKPGHVTDEQERKALVRAERFIRQVGYICESEQELRAELAERKWPCDEHLVALWREVRPIGEQLERETIERAEHWKRTRAALRGTPDPDADIVW